MVQCQALPVEQARLGFKLARYRSEGDSRHLDFHLGLVDALFRLDFASNTTATNDDISAGLPASVPAGRAS
jgi:hypothetical protein